jgi:hypothetical protein
MVMIGYLGFSSPTDEKLIETVIEDLIVETNAVKKQYDGMYLNVYAELSATNHALSKATTDSESKQAKSYKTK